MSAFELQRAKGLFESNDPAKGGSDYFRQKITIAEKIILEVCVCVCVSACSRLPCFRVRERVCARMSMWLSACTLARCMSLCRCRGSQCRGLCW
jgi:hypothetical protein